MKQGFSLLKLFAWLVLIFGLMSILATFVPDRPDEPQTGIGVRAGILVLGIVLTGGGFIGIAIPVYNRLVAGRNRCQMGLSNIDILLKRRHDLIDNLVSVAERYAKHESVVLTEVAARRGTGAPSTMAEKTEEVKMRFAPTFLAVAEAYPELRADQTFTRLFEQLRETEDTIATGRIEYNNAVLEQNTRIGSFPDLLVARVFRFTEQDFYKLGEGEEHSPVLGRTT